MKKSIIVGLVLICLQQFTNAQSMQSFRAITVDNGLSNFIVTAFYKDSTGFMWIGTDISLDRFDGLNFKHYFFDQADQNKVRVKTIVETNSKKLFVGNESGLWILNKETDKLERFEPKVIDVSVNHLFFNKPENLLYIATNKGLYLYDEKTNKISQKKLTDNILSPANNITAISLSVDKKQLWLSTQSGLWNYNLKSKSLKCYNNLSGDNTNCFQKIICLENYVILATNDKGLYKFNTSNSTFTKWVDVGSEFIKELLTDGNDLIYVATDGNGIQSVSLKQSKIVESLKYTPRKENVIRSNSVYSMYIDKNGIFWIGYYQAGLDYSLFQRHTFETYYFPPAFNTHGLPIRCFHVRKNEKLIGTREGLFYINEDKNIVREFTKADLRSGLILSVEFYNGEYYIGTFGGGLSILNPVTFQLRTLNLTELSHCHVFHITVGRKNDIWFSTSNGLYRYIANSQQINSYTSKNSQLNNGYVYYMFFDSTNKGWIATANGLSMYDLNTNMISSDVFPVNFFNKQVIKGIYEDKNHRLYFCPDKGNILTCNLDMQYPQELKMTKQFNRRVFTSVFQDKSNQFWFGSDYGLIKMSGENDSYTRYSFEAGIPDPVFYANAVSQDEEGTLWFGNAKGLVYLKPGSLNSTTKNKHNYKVLFTDIKIFGENSKYNFQTDKIEEIELKYNKSSFLAQFSNLSFSHPDRIVYEYQLAGMDTTWKTLPGGKSELIFENLKVGKYTLKVRTEGDSLSETRLIIKVKSFFNFWFYFFVILAISAIYFLYSRFLLKYHQLQQMNSELKLENEQYYNELHKDTEKYKFAKLTDKECRIINEQISKYMSDKKPFMNPELKVSDISKAMNLPSLTISFFLNQYLKKNFYDYINEFRVQEFKFLANDHENSRFTISALAEKCGFTSRTSFFRSFKKVTGITPNEYIKRKGLKIRD